MENILISLPGLEQDENKVEGELYPPSYITTFSPLLQSNEKTVKDINTTSLVDAHVILSLVDIILLTGVIFSDYEI